MRLAPREIAAYEEAGYLLLPRVLPERAIDLLNGELPALCAARTPDRVCEVDGETTRSLYGSHLRHELFRSLTLQPPLLEPARQLLEGDVYVYQMKINLKSAATGDLWPWHQDLIYWQRDDGLPGDQILNVVLLLDDVTESNGPLQLVPGSHRLGVIDVPARSGERAETYRDSPPWIDDVIAALRYAIDPPRLGPLLQRGVVTLTAPRGSLLIFHPNLVHGSPRNHSARDRRLLFVTYNRTDNLPVPVGEPRPEFLVSRDYRALQSRPDPRLGG